jgi:hypothetical protein
MGRKRLLKVVSCYKLTAGSHLAQAMTATSPRDGDPLKVEQVTDFDPSGGTALIRSEQIAYSTVNEDTDELVGIVRGFNGTTAVAHSDGTFIQEGTEETVEKWARGKLDDEEEIREIPVPSYLYAMLRVGTYTDETAPTIPVYYDEDEDEVIVSDGPLGAVPSFDEDLEVLPPVGGGDSSQSTTDPNTGKVLPPKGMGYEDGEAPLSSPTPTVVGGIGTLFVRFPTIANSSTVKYKVHVHTTTGFTPAANTLVGTVDLAGTQGFNGVLPIKDFPTGHVLDGTASDPPQAGTTYFAKVIASDGSGDAPASAQASGTPVKVQTADIIAAAITADLIAAAAITSTKIEDGAISTPKLAAGAVTAVKIAAGTITANEIQAGSITGDRIAANTLTADHIAANAITADEISAGAVTAGKISVSTLSAISANIGTITAGSLSAVTITSATLESNTIRSDSTGSSIRVEIKSSNAGTVEWRGSGDPGTLHARVFGDTAGQAELYGANLVNITAPGASGELLFRTRGTTKMSIDTNPKFHVRPNWDSSLVTAGAGSLVGYLQVQVGGTNYKVPYYNV